MKTNASVTVKNKIYPYSLERTKAGTIRFIAKSAKIDQEFLAEDVSEIILDLPNLIVAEQTYEKDNLNTIRFRVTPSDKAKIDKRAMEKGYSSVSAYLRDLALG